MPYNLDLTAGTETCPDGLYRWRILDCENKVSTNSGNAYVDFTCRVVEGDQEGFEASLMLTITAKAMFKIVEFLAAMGVPQEILGSAKDYPFEPRDYIGREFLGETKTALVNNRPRTNIDKMFPLSDDKAAGAGAAKKQR